MKKSGIEKWLQRAHQKSPRSDDYSADLKEWIRQVINEAEKNGDINKKNQFLALSAEL